MIEAPELPLWAAILTAFLVVAGAAFTLIGAVGLARLRVFYQRVHAPTLGATLGATLILLASIFFSGLFFGLDRVTWPARAISYALPSTYSIRALQDEMLRGVVQHPNDIWILAGAALVLFVLAVVLFRREFSPASGSRLSKAALPEASAAPSAEPKPGEDRPRGVKTESKPQSSHR